MSYYNGRRRNYNNGYPMYKRIAPPYGYGQWGSEISSNININGGTTQVASVIITNGFNTTGGISYNDLWVKDFKLTLNMIASTPTLVYWALIYVQEGYPANTLSTSNSAETYTPNKNAIMTGCFIANTDSQPEIRYSKQFRKLNANHTGTNAGDSIVFICLSPTSSAAYSVVGTINYKVKAT